MMRLSLLLWALLALVVLVTSRTHYDDQDQTALLVRELYLRKGATLSVTVTDTSLATFVSKLKRQYSFRMAVLVTDSLYPGSGCHHETLSEAIAPDGNEHLLVIPLMRQSSWKAAKAQYLVRDDGTYYVYFSNCEPNSAVSFTVDVESHSPPLASLISDTLFCVLLVVILIYAVVGFSWVSFSLHRPSNLQKAHALLFAALAVKLFLLVILTVRRGVGLFYGTDSEPVTSPAFVFLSMLYLAFMGALVLTYLDGTVSLRCVAIVQSAVLTQILASTSGVVFSYVGSAAALERWKTVMFLIDCGAGVCVAAAPISVALRLKGHSAAVEKSKELYQMLVRFSTIYVSLFMYIIAVSVILGLSNNGGVLVNAPMRTLVSELSLALLFCIDIIIGRPQQGYQYLLLGTAQTEVQLAELGSRSDGVHDS
jgi:hypothetical protein